MKIVFLDVKTIGEDIDLSGFDRFGEVVKYDFSTSEEVPERVQDADVIILNKVQVNEQTIEKQRIPTHLNAFSRFRESADNRSPENPLSSKPNAF